MGRNLIVWSVLAVLLLGATGCRTAKEASSGALILLDQNSVNSVILLHAGDYARLTLEENATTGYRWEFRTEGKAVRISKNEFEAPKSRLCGAPGVRQVYLQAVGPGKTQVEAVLRRPWEKGQPPARKLVYSLRVLD